MRRRRRRDRHAGCSRDALQGLRDEARFAAILGERPRLQSFVRRHFTDAHAVEEIVAETYFVAWRRLNEVPDDVDRAVGWLCGVARNLIRNHVRGETRRRRLVDHVTNHVELGLHDRDWVDTGLAPGVDRIVALQAWDELPAADREILAWKMLGVPHDQVAEALGIRVSAVAMRLMRARSRLNDILDDGLNV